MTPEVRQFLDAKVLALEARARRLSRLTPQTVGIRPADVPFTPSNAHFRAANQRLAEIDRGVRQQLSRLRASLGLSTVQPVDILRRCALVERMVDRARRTFALYFDVMSQRGTAFAPALAACDTIAADCFAAARQVFPDLLGGPVLKPVTYVEQSFSPATYRRGVMLRRLLGERNPFPLVRVPHERLESPWGMGVILHEVGHNLQADLGIWQETEAAVRRRVLGHTHNPLLTRIWTRWQKEIFADCIAILLGGPAAAEGMKDFLSYAPPQVMNFRALSVHPVPYLRGFLLAEMVERAGFPADANRIRRVWTSLYGAAARGSRIPPLVLDSAGSIIPEVIDEIAYAPRRGLAGHSLSDILPFHRADQARILRAAEAMGEGHVPADLPPRFVVGASRYALERRLAAPVDIARLAIQHLNRPLSSAAPSVRAAA